MSSKDKDKDQAKKEKLALRIEKYVPTQTELDAQKLFNDYYEPLHRKEEGVAGAVTDIQGLLRIIFPSPPSDPVDFPLDLNNLGGGGGKWAKTKDEDDVDVVDSNLPKAEMADSKDKDKFSIWGSNSKTNSLFAQLEKTMDVLGMKTTTQQEDEEEPQVHPEQQRSASTSTDFAAEEPETESTEESENESQGQGASSNLRWKEVQDKETEEDERPLSPNKDREDEIARLQRYLRGIERSAQERNSNFNQGGFSGTENYTGFQHQQSPRGYIPEPGPFLQQGIQNPAATTAHFANQGPPMVFQPHLRFNSSHPQFQLNQNRSNNYYGASGGFSQNYPTQPPRYQPPGSRPPPGFDYPVRPPPGFDFPYVATSRYVSPVPTFHGPRPNWPMGGGYANGVLPILRPGPQVYSRYNPTPAWMSSYGGAGAGQDQAGWTPWGYGTGGHQPPQGNFQYQSGNGRGYYQQPQQQQLQNLNEQQQGPALNFGPDSSDHTDN